MDFSLEGMFRNLHNIINDDEMDTGETLEDIIVALVWWRNLAIKCGQIKEKSK
jgi:hypothetical protein